MFKDRKPDHKGFVDIGDKAQMADEAAIKKEI